MRDASLSAALALALALALAAPAAAQQKQQSPAPPAQQAPPPAAPPKPYKPVAVQLPAVVNDATFDAFRKDLAGVAQRKDRAALTRMIVAKGFFWEALAGFAAETTAAPLPEQKAVLCGPASPVFDERELEELSQTTDTDPLEWGYPMRADVEVRETPNATAPVIDKLGLILVRVLDDDAQSTANTGGEWLRVVVPSGQVGFVSADAIASLTGAQLCYTKEGTTWKIAGLVGGGE